MERAAPGFPIWPCTRWGFPCLRDCSWSGGLLPRLFTLTASRSRRRFKFLRHFPSKDFNLSPACIPCPAAGVTRHRALWSSDFPPPACAGSDSPPFQNHRYLITVELLGQGGKVLRRACCVFGMETSASHVVYWNTQYAIRNTQPAPLNPQTPNPCPPCNKGCARN